MTIMSLEIYCSIAEGQLIYERFHVGSGEILQLPLSPCQRYVSDASAQGSCGESVVQMAMSRIGAAPGAVQPTETTCGVAMSNYESCQAVCAGGAQVAGFIRCLDGKLTGSSICGPSTNDDAMAIQKFKAVFGALDMKASGALNSDDMKGALVQALAPGTKQIRKEDVLVSWTKEQLNERRLVDHQPACRSLKQESQTAHNFSWTYEVLVNPAGPSSGDISKEAMQLSTPSSSASSVFTSKLSDAGVCVDSSSIRMVVEPQTFMQEVFVKAGEVVVVKLPIDSNPQINVIEVKQPVVAAVQRPPEEKAGNAAAVVGAIIGGLFGLIIILGGCYYFIVMRKMAEA